MCKGQLKYEELTSKGWELIGMRMPQEWCHEGGVGSEVRKKLKMGTLDHGFPWSRQSEFRDRDCLILMLIFLFVLSSGDL